MSYITLTAKLEDVVDVEELKEELTSRLGDSLVRRLTDELERQIVEQIMSDPHNSWSHPYG